MPKPLPPTSSLPVASSASSHPRISPDISEATRAPLPIEDGSDSLDASNASNFQDAPPPAYTPRPSEPTRRGEKEAGIEAKGKNSHSNIAVAGPSRRPFSDQNSTSSWSWSLSGMVPQAASGYLSSAEKQRDLAVRNQIKSLMMELVTAKSTQQDETAFVLAECIDNACRNAGIDRLSIAPWELLDFDANELGRDARGALLRGDDQRASTWIEQLTRTVLASANSNSPLPVSCPQWERICHFIESEEFVSRLVFGKNLETTQKTLFEVGKGYFVSAVIRPHKQRLMEHLETGNIAEALVVKEQLFDFIAKTEGWAKRAEFTSPRSRYLYLLNSFAHNNREAANCIRTIMTALSSVNYTPFTLEWDNPSTHQNTYTLTVGTPTEPQNSLSLSSPTIPLSDAQIKTPGWLSLAVACGVSPEKLFLATPHAPLHIGRTQNFLYLCLLANDEDTYSKSYPWLWSGSTRPQPKEVNELSQALRDPNSRQAAIQFLIHYQARATIGSSGLTPLVWDEEISQHLPADLALWLKS